MPAVVFPQLLLCGLFVPRDEMAAPSVALAAAAHLRLRRARPRDGTGAPAASLMLDVLVVGGATVAALALAAVTLRRRTP